MYCSTIDAQVFTDAVPIAGPVARRKIEQTLAKLGQFVPTIATPEEILESTR